VPFNEYEYILSKIHQTILVFLSIIMQVFPFLMGGALLSACIHEFGSDRFAERFISRSGFLSIPAALLAAYTEGIRNILAVTGDPVPEGSRGSVKSVFNLSSVKLCRYIQSMNNEMFSSDPMLYGCAFNANSGNIRAEYDHLSSKIDAGASFILSQPVFSETSFEALSEAGEKGIPLFAGIFIPVSFKNAHFLANEMPGFDIPEHILSRFSPSMSREEGEIIGIDIASEIIRRLSGTVDGFYIITPFNRAEVSRKLLLKVKGAF
jgi:homocysteine S-methyltransferase